MKRKGEPGIEAIRWISISFRWCGQNMDDDGLRVLLVILYWPPSLLISFLSWVYVELVLLLTFSMPVPGYQPLIGVGTRISIWSCFIEAFFRPEFFGGFHESSSFTTLGNTILKQKIICKLSMQNTLHASPYSFSTFQSSYHLTSKFQSSYCLTHLTECRHFKDDLTSIFKSSPNSNILKLALPNSPNWILI